MCGSQCFLFRGNRLQMALSVSKVPTADGGSQQGSTLCINHNTERNGNCPVTLHATGPAPVRVPKRLRRADSQSIRYADPLCLSTETAVWECAASNRSFSCALPGSGGSTGAELRVLRADPPRSRMLCGKSDLFDQTTLCCQCFRLCQSFE